MADLHPNDIGLATFEDVGDVSTLQTNAKKVVDAINEIKETGSSLSSLEDQLYVDGENNIILGKGNVVYGSNNLVIGSDNVVAANNLIVLGSGKQAYATPDNFYASYDFNTGGVYCDGGTDTASMFAIGDKAVLEVSASWASEDWSDYRSVDSGKQIVTVSGIDGTTLQFEQFEVDTSPPDAEHPILEYIYINIFVPLNAAFHLDMPENADVLLMGTSAEGTRSCSANYGKAEGSGSFAANSGRAQSSYSAAFGSSSAAGIYAFAANKARANAEAAAAFNDGYSYAPYSMAVGYSARAYGRAIKCTALNNAAKTLTAASGQDLNSLTGKKLYIRCYNKINTIIFKEATVSGVSGTTISLTDVSFSTNDYAEYLFPDGYVFVNDTSTSYGRCNLAGGYYGVAATRYSLGYGLHVAAAHENSVVFGKYGTSDANGSLALANGTSLKAQGLAFKVLSSGAVHADAAYTTPCADYAEFFEWADGNPDGEDRAGYFVKPEGEKIVKCGEFDTPLGVVSAAPAIIGDSGELHWHGKFATDDFGRVQYHDVTVPAELDEDGNIIAEEHIERQPVLNPEWDNTTEYVPRKDRKEWAAVGVLGKLVVYDDGTLQSGDLCRCGENGTAVKSVKNGYPVLKRISDDKVLIWLK